MKDMITSACSQSPPTWPLFALFEPRQQLDNQSLRWHRGLTSPESSDRRNAGCV